MQDIEKYLQRSDNIFEADVVKFSTKLSQVIENSSFLVLGGAGSIGQSLTKELFKRNPRALHVVDINENNLVELVRDLRSSFGYIPGDFRTFCLDIDSVEFDSFTNQNKNYDYILNFSALKHVRSEKDQFSLMRLITVNILNTIKLVKFAESINAKNFFCVSTDKAANPVNLMGASKLMMEKLLMRSSISTPISTARFANVAFSDGSLLHGFYQRYQKKQPLSAPNDIERYFMTPKEAGELCMIACLLGQSRDIFFPKIDSRKYLAKFSDIAKIFLNDLGFEPIECISENQARSLMPDLTLQGKWACFFAESDTAGEKLIEEFYMPDEELVLNKFEGIGIIKKPHPKNEEILNVFLTKLQTLKNSGTWEKKEILSLFQAALPEFNHKDADFNLDQKM